MNRTIADRWRLDVSFSDNEAEMNEIGAFSEPLNVEVVDGEVVVLGPRGPTGLSLTPGAAAETATRMAAAAEVARIQASHTWPREP